MRAHDLWPINHLLITSQSGKKVESMSKIITRALKDMKTRKAELQPLAAEFRQVESAIQALEAVNGGSKPATRGPGSGTATGRRRGHPRKGERTRAEQFFALVKEHPGVTINEAAKQLDAQPTSLYRVVSKLETEGSIDRDGRGFVAREARLQETSAPVPSESSEGAVEPHPKWVGEVAHCRVLSEPLELSRPAAHSDGETRTDTDRA